MRISDWSSDVCSSDLDARARTHAARPRPPEVHLERQGPPPPEGPLGAPEPLHLPAAPEEPGGAGEGGAGGERRDRKSVVKGKSVSVRVDLGGRRIIKKKKQVIKVIIIRLSKIV